MPAMIKKTQMTAESNQYEVASKAEVMKILAKSNKKNAVALSELAK